MFNICDFDYYLSDDEETQEERYERESRYGLDLIISGGIKND